MITVTSLRKIFTEQGVKGASKWKREDFTSAIIAAEFAAHTEDEAKTAEATMIEYAAKPAKRVCEICQDRRPSTKAQRDRMGLGRDYADMCIPCYEEAGWENTHSDEGHNEDAKSEGCWICFPELNEAKRPAPVGRSRAGMVIVAKGTEIHKSNTFKVAAEAAGWTVTMMSETYELPEGTTGEGTRYYATATRMNGINPDVDSISLAWDGRAYDYPASSARLNGKARKVRNLKEALRLL